jgi:3-phenylpropionate/trans-cinnamate dioxygenase ferredoxin subunit
VSFEKACSLDEFREGEAVAAKVGDQELALARDGDEFFAVEDICSHAAVALSEGEVDGCTLECWLHGSRFDLRTGKPTGLPATEPVATFPVEVRGTELYVDVTTTTGAAPPEALAVKES